MLLWVLLYGLVFCYGVYYMGFYGLIWGYYSVLLYYGVLLWGIITGCYYGVSEERQTDKKITANGFDSVGVFLW